MTNPLKRHVAIIIPGGIGTGYNNVGVPVLERIIKALSLEFAVTVFQLFPANINYKAEGFELIECYSTNSVKRVLKFAITFWRIHTLKKFDVVHGFWAFPGGFLAVLMGKIFRIKSLISLQGGDAIALPEINYGQLLRWFPRKLIIWALHRTDELISPTRYMIDNLRKYGLKRSEIKYIPLGVDTKLFTFHEKKLNKPIRFLHIGNFNRVKDQSTLLKAFRIISEKVLSELTIIGEGELENELKSLAYELELDGKIFFQKPVPYESLRMKYTKSDILLHTSLSEGHPIVVEEAMSSGVVVCGTKVGLLYDLPDCCISVDVKDFESLAAATLELIHDSHRTMEMRQLAHQWATSHSMQWTVDEMKTLYSTRIHG